VPAPDPAQRKNDEARAVLARRFPAPAAEATPKLAPKARAPTDPKKLAALRKVELMKLRHHAQPADARDTPARVPLEQRLFVKVRAEEGAGDKAFWLRKVRACFPVCFRAVLCAPLSSWLISETTRPRAPVGRSISCLCTLACLRLTRR
jgi:hypothetical protein